jgi:acyl carrier protein
MNRRKFAILGLGLTAQMLTMRSTAAAQFLIWRADKIGPLIKQIIVEQLGVDLSQVKESARFVDDLGADSLDQAELVLAFEEAFEIQISDKDAESLVTVGKAIKYVTTTLKSIGRIRLANFAPNSATKTK